MNIVPTKLRFFHDKGIKIRGVIHVGMSWGEEIPDYVITLGAKHVIGFEPLEEAFNEAVKFCGDLPGVILVNQGLGDIDTTLTMHKIDDPHPMPGHPVGTGGSSFLKDIQPLAPELKVTEMGLRVRRFFNWFSENATKHGIKIDDFNALVIDVQGMELDVLKGFAGYLDHFDVANIECSRVPVYEGEAPAADVVAYMNQNGFAAVSPVEDHNDILFQR